MATVQLLNPSAHQPFSGCYRHRRVFLTGHTGFKGAWLAEWLLQLGAEVTGFALAPPTNPALFDQLGLQPRLHHIMGDVRDQRAVARAIAAARPEIVFHLAAQPLVRQSYAQPVDTFAVNVMGTVNVLDAIRGLDQPCTVVAITTDKCYENREWLHSYREEDPLGGYDPYSASKAAAEMVIAAYRRSFFTDAPVRLASARAGNVIGGGDWAVDRIVPDCVRALQRGEPIPVRNRVATRPWQHVLEPLSGYLWLGARLAESDFRGQPVRRSLGEGGRSEISGQRSADGDSQLSALNAQLSSAFNFGPELSSNRTVLELVQEVLAHWPGKWEDRSDPAAVHEAKLLNLAIDKAHHLLDWKPVWSFERTIATTMQWYRAVNESPAGAAEITRKQISDYIDSAHESRVAWAGEVTARNVARST